MKTRFLSLLFAALLFAGAANALPRVGMIVSGYTDDTELKELSRRLGVQAEVKEIPLASLASQKLSDYAVLYYHRSSTAPISAEEIAAGAPVTDYVKQGGKLVLSMEAVLLMNSWGIESQPLQTETRMLEDVGHGRAVGFRGYIEHPLYENSNGGTYVWFSPEDNEVRTIGFSGDALPRAEGSEVIGVEWIYIKYNEDRKLVWETPLGKGRILCIGGYLYYSKKNLNVKVLDIFTANVLKYMLGTSPVKRALTWSYDTTRCEVSEVRLKLDKGTAYDWSTPKTDLDSSRLATQNFPWDLCGPQISVMGTEKKGIEEVWTHPVMGFRDYDAGVKLAGEDNVIWLKDMMPKVTNGPAVFEREYTFANGATLTEMVVADTEEPLMAVYYKTTGAIEKVYVKYATNLRYMWPYPADCIGALNYAYSADHSSTVVHDPMKMLSVVSNFNIIPQRVNQGLCSDFKVENGALVGVPTDERKLAFIYEFDGNDAKNFRVLFSGGSEGVDKAVSYIEKEQGAKTKIETRSSAYYNNFADEFISIKTDDEKFNADYKWAMIALDQMYCNTPGIGKSLFAGYAPTSKGWNGWQKVSGRPGYAWYFGRDSEWMSMALNYIGNTEKVRGVIETLGHTQSPDGKVYHEYTTSGSVHYDAADATPLYIMLAAYYLQQTGDIDFIRKEWPYIKKAIDFCYSTDTDGDNLIENTNQGHGWIEGGPLYGFHTTFYMAGIWAATLREAAYIAKSLGDGQLAAQYTADQAKAQEAVNKIFWNDKTNFYNLAMWRDRTFSDEQAVLVAVPVLLGVTDPDKSEISTDRFSTKYFSSDWGTRMLGYNSSYYDPGSYHYGSVWPLFTGWASLAEYKVGRNLQGFRHVRNNLHVMTKWDYGAAPEVLSGAKFAPAGVCMHHGWSNSMALLPLYEGMLGLRPEGMRGELGIAPAFPMDWSFAEVHNISVGKSVLNLDYRREANGYRYDFTKKSGKDVTLNFAAKLPLGTTVKGVTRNGKKVKFTVTQERGDVRVTLPQFTLSGKDEIVITTKGGIAVLANLPEVEVGDADQGVKIPSESLEGNTYKLMLQGEKGRTYTVELFNRMEVKSIGGATLKESGKPDVTAIEVTFPDGEENFTDREVVMELK